MSTFEDQTIPTATVSVDSSGWEQHENRVFRCHVYLRPEYPGFSVRAARLPGVVSQGEDEQEALDNIAEAYQGAIESYRTHKEEIPWCPDTKDQDEFERSVIVHA